MPEIIREDDLSTSLHSSSFLPLMPSDVLLVRLETLGGFENGL